MSLILAIGAGLGCDRKGSTTEEPELIPAIGTIYPLADVVRAVGGKRTDVSWFIETGQSLNTAPADYRTRLGLADLVVSRGADEQWALESVEDQYRATRFIRLDLFPNARGVPGYVWLDPSVIKQLTAALRERLTNLNPEYKELFRMNQESFDRDLDELVAEFSSRVPKGAVAMSLTPDFEPLAKAFQVELIPILTTPNATLNDRTLVQLRKTVAARGVKTLFVPADHLPAVQRDLESKTGLRVLTLDALGSSAKSGRNTYLQIMRYNLEQLEQGLK